MGPVWPRSLVRSRTTARSVLGGLCLAAALTVGAGQAAAQIVPISAQSAEWRPQTGDTLAFDVYRNGERFGTHLVSFERVGEALTIESNIELKVAFGPITAYHYVQSVNEVWIAGRLETVVARTKNEGKWRDFAARAVEGGLRIAGSAFQGVRPGLLIPSTHWNIAEMRQPAMLSTETGEMLPMTVIDKGIERVRVGAGEIEARRFLVKSDLDADFWYDAQGRWVKCAFTAQGSKVEYRLRKLPG